MACQDCYCGRKEAEEAGVQPEKTSKGCGPVEFDGLLKAYEEGEISREDFIRLVGKGYA